MGIMSGGGWFVNDMFLTLYFHCLTPGMIAEEYR